MNAIIDVKRIDGKPALRYDGTPVGAWIVAATDIDAMLNHVKHELQIPQMVLYAEVELDPASVSRCRAGHLPIQEHWILRLSDYSGIPPAELRRVACIEPVTRPHANARRPA